MNNSFFLGVYPGLDQDVFSYTLSIIDGFINSLGDT